MERYQAEKPESLSQKVFQPISRPGIQEIWKKQKQRQSKEVVNPHQNSATFYYEPQDQMNCSLTNAKGSEGKMSIDLFEEKGADQYQIDWKVGKYFIEDVNEYSASYMPNMGKSMQNEENEAKEGKQPPFGNFKQTLMESEEKPPLKERILPKKPYALKKGKKIVSNEDYSLPDCSSEDVNQSSGHYQQDRPSSEDEQMGDFLMMQGGYMVEEGQEQREEDSSASEEFIGEPLEPSQQIHKPDADQVQSYSAQMKSNSKGYIKTEGEVKLERHHAKHRQRYLKGQGDPIAEDCYIWHRSELKQEEASMGSLKKGLLNDVEDLEDEGVMTAIKFGEIPRELMENYQIGRFTAIVEAKCQLIRHSQGGRVRYRDILPEVKEQNGNIQNAQGNQNQNECYQGDGREGSRSPNSMAQESRGFFRRSLEEATEERNLTKYQLIYLEEGYPVAECQEIEGVHKMQLRSSRSTKDTVLSAMKELQKIGVIKIKVTKVQKGRVSEEKGEDMMKNQCVQESESEEVQNPFGNAYGNGKKKPINKSKKLKFVYGPRKTELSACQKKMQRLRQVSEKTKRQQVKERQKQKSGVFEYTIWHSVELNLGKYYKNAMEIYGQGDSDSKSAYKQVMEYFTRIIRQVKDLSLCFKTEETKPKKGKEYRGVTYEKFSFEQSKADKSSPAQRNPASQLLENPHEADEDQGPPEENYFTLPYSRVRPSTPSSLFSGELKEYQKMTLSWMLYREMLSTNNLNVIKYSIERPKSHYLWKELTQHNLEYSMPILRDKSDLDDQNVNSLYYNLKNNQILNFKPKMVKRVKGGILADEMGLGKTIMCLSLIATHIRRKSTAQEFESGNLIVVPLSVLGQWEAAIRLHLPRMSLLVYNKSVALKYRRVMESDIVLTTQGKLKSQYLREGKQAFTLFDFKWFRFFIDEAHALRNLQSIYKKSVSSLKSEYKWLLTGTPIHNKINDLCAYIDILRYEPWNGQSSIKMFLNQQGGPISNIHQLQLKEILKDVIIRRKKNDLDEYGNRLLEIEDYETKTKLIKFSREEWIRYIKITKCAIKDIDQLINRLQISENLRKTKGDIIAESDKYHNFKRKAKKLKFDRIESSNGVQYKNEDQEYFFAVVSKMRMFCCHHILENSRSKWTSYEDFYKKFLKIISNPLGPGVSQRKIRYDLVPSEEAMLNELQKGLYSQDSFRKKRTEKQLNIYSKIMRRDKFTCEICREELSKGVISRCMHLYCEDCLKNQWRRFKKQREYTINDGEKRKIFYLKCVNSSCEDEIHYQEYEHLPRINRFDVEYEKIQPNEKINQLLEGIRIMKVNEKCIVFTFFLGMIEIIELILRREGVLHVKMQGSDNYQEREKALKNFKENSQIKVFLVSTQCGYAGLNLQTANKVFFIDPWWNPAIEDQAIGRVHRIGQEKKVEAVRFVTECSIEIDISLLSEKKRKFTKQLLDSNQSVQRVAKMDLSSGLQEYKRLRQQWVSIVEKDEIQKEFRQTITKRMVEKKQKEEGFEEIYPLQKQNEKSK